MGSLYQDHSFIMSLFCPWLLLTGQQEVHPAWEKGQKGHPAWESDRKATQPVKKLQQFREAYFWVPDLSSN